MDNKDMLKIAAPLIAMGTVWVAQRALQSAYEHRTGHDVPRAEDMGAPITRVILFSASAAVVAAVINVAVTRGVAKATNPDQNGIDEV